jgi:hypothetical protein
VCASPFSIACSGDTLFIQVFADFLYGVFHPHSLSTPPETYKESRDTSRERNVALRELNLR